MSETLQYIDRYFNGDMSASEKSTFEDRCESDQAFAEEVAFYVSARAGLEMEADLQMKKRFDRLYADRRGKRTGIIKKLIPFVTIAAAASVILFLGWFFLTGTPSAKQLADRYIEHNFQAISPSLGNNKDRLEIAKNAFNNKNYAEAEKIFTSLLADTNLGSQATEYLGILYLVTRRYDMAVGQFESLSGDHSLHTNFGPFYKAIALIERNKEGDHQQAKIILEQIIRDDLPGRKEAEEWVKRL